MRRTLLLWIAAASILVTVEAARRPRYGGELRMEMRAAPATIESAEFIENQVFETLVRLDEHGDPQPWLATSWAHDAARKRWVFTPRANVILHNGATWSPGPIAMPDDRAIEQILRDLAGAKNEVGVRAEDGSMDGTGPFRIARWEAEKSATLAAHDGYWGGRPYLDAIQIQMGRGWREQALDLEVGRADVVEIPVTELRRLQQRGASVFRSGPAEVLALQFCNRRVTA